MRRPQARRGASLLEVMVVLTIFSVMLAMAVPSYRRAVEQARAEVAAAKLRAVWSAQRLYWLEHHTYAASLAELELLLDPAITASALFYSYAIPAADDTTFSITATRVGSSKWSGQLTIDQTGTVSGALQAAGEANIVPGSP